jgi:hypothetical protein
MMVQGYTRQEAEKIVNDIGFDALFADLMVAAMPKSMDDAETMVNSLMHSLIQAVSILAFYHIDDHKGYSCARNMISKMLPDDLCPIAYSRLNELLALEGMDLLEVEDDPNAELRAEILKDMEKKNEETNGGGV